MYRKYNFSKQDNDRCVYVRAVQKSELSIAAQQQAGDADHMYAIHTVDGEQLALVHDRELAFAVARTNDFNPVSVH